MCGEYNFRCNLNWMESVGNLEMKVSKEKVCIIKHWHTIMMTRIKNS